jgi:hypothetical protein
MDDKKLMALAKKNAARSQAPRKATPKYDATLDATKKGEDADRTEADQIFREMKRREF